jgi:5-oxoprolinase (ATP-hydrolysing)
MLSKDLLEIGNQTRPDIFALNIRKPEVLYSAVLEVDERVTLVGYTADPEAAQHAPRFDDAGAVQQAYSGEDAPPPAHDGSEPPVERGVSGEAVAVLRRPDREQVRRDLQRLFDDGFRALAIVLMHSYTYPAHEQLVAEVARDVGFTHVSVSSALMPMIRIVPRGVSATADAYLTPVLADYIDGFFAGFDASLRDGSAGTRVEFMMSDGGLTSVERFSGLKSVISGPAGGVVGMALTSWDAQDGRPVIGLDMGGTSTGKYGGVRRALCCSPRLQTSRATPAATSRSLRRRSRA